MPIDREDCMPQRFKKRPVVIEAVQYDGNNASTILDWITRASGRASMWVGNGTRKIAIPTLEGTMYADSGDWIIRGVAGEFYPCKPDIFSATYEPVVT